MIDLTFYLCDFQNALNLVAVIAAVVLSAECVWVVRHRHSTYPWLSYSFAMLLFAIACNRVISQATPPSSSRTCFISIDTITNLFLVLSALLIPFVRKSMNKHIKYADLRSINARLSNSQQLLRNFLKSIPAPAYIKNKNLKYTYVSEAVKRLFGRDPRVSEEHGALFDNANAEKEIDLRVLQNQEKIELVRTVDLDNGSRTLVDIRFPLIGPERERMLGGIVVDITKEINWRNRIDALASIVELAPDAIYSYDRTGVIVTWNAAAEKMFGYKREEIVGKSAQTIIPHERRNDVELISQFVSSGRILKNFETVRVTRDGTRKSVVVAAAPARGPIRRTMVNALIVRDITESKRIEEKIRVLHGELKAKVEELSAINANLEKAKDEALESAALKSAFVANISHELRTPLGGILGMSEILSRQPLSEAAMEMVTMLQQAAETLLDVVNGILDLAKLEAGRAIASNESFSIADLVNECAKSYLPAASSKHLGLRVVIEHKVPQRISTDPHILKQVLLNLLSNAVRFTRSGWITIGITNLAEGETGQMLRIDISDTGIGIPEEDRKMLFTPFARITQASDGHKSAGLGLNVSKRFIELLGGHLSCESSPGTGSTFSFSVPYTLTEHIPKEARLDELSKIPLQELSQCRVLVVDDSPVLSRLTVRQLGLLGLQSEIASTADEALHMAKAKEFDVILLDVHLPDMTGYEVAQKLRTMEARGSIGHSTIIAMTGSVTMADRDKALQSGMDDFLGKPFTIEQMRKTLFLWLAQGKTAA